MRSLQSKAFGLPFRFSKFSPNQSHIPASIRFASLSAIHRGLRRSERVQYGEVKPWAPSTRGRRDDKGSQSLTEKALEGAGSKRQQLRLIRKLKKKEEEETGTGRKTRRKRFNDPDSEFGKKSLVYQMKHGSLQHLVSKIDEPVRPRPIRGGFRREPRYPRDDANMPPATRLDRPSSADFAKRFHGNVEDTQPTEQPRAFRRGPTNSRSSRDGFNLFSRQRREDTNSSFKMTMPAPRERLGKFMPMTIKYTTAASQFLYGKSVVKAALDQGRRKLYNLYIYGGENRQESKDNEIISSLAKMQGVPITIVPTEDQRLMDKMSQGRPHNGFVLETSPIPQLPITALGPLEENPSRLGFNVKLDHQSKEEEAVNGTESFIPRSSSVTAKPYVLLLNEILDPGNLGALLRTASYFGADAVGITNRNSAKLSPVVLKSAAGAVEEMTIFTVDSPVSFLEESRKAGWVSYAAVAAPDKKLAQKHGGKFISSSDVEHDQPLNEKPCILVLGNEGYGLSKDLKVAADYELSVPRFLQDSCIDSLNVSVAAGLLCHSFVKGQAKPRVKPSKKKTPSDTTEPSQEKVEDSIF